MTSTGTDKTSNLRSLGNFAAIKTAIANGDVGEVKSRMQDKTINELEKRYLVDLAKFNGESEMVDLIEALPENLAT